ncbi:unnamed protein product, partial [Staurois parvus]
CRLLLQTFVKDCAISPSVKLLLNIPWSTVSGIITMWKQMGTTATQTRSGRPHKMRERRQHMLKRTFCRSR